jgi:hypothetical protein
VSAEPPASGADADDAHVALQRWGETCHVVGVGGEDDRWVRACLRRVPDGRVDDGDVRGLTNVRGAVGTRASQIDVDSRGDAVDVGRGRGGPVPPFVVRPSGGTPLRLPD